MLSVRNRLCTYGGNVILNEITALPVNGFSEIEIGEVFPEQSWSYPDGIHHTELMDSVIFVDAK